MALISVDRKPTILGTKTTKVTKWKDGPGSAPYAWSVIRSLDFTSLGGGSLSGTTLRFHTILVTNNGPVSVQMIMDTSTSPTATSADYSFNTGLSLGVGETLTLDVASLGGVTGIRRIMLVNNLFEDTTAGAVPYEQFTYSTLDFQVGFYTAQQSA